MNSDVNLVTIATTVIWLVVAIGGVLGFCLRYQQAQAPAKEKPPITAQMMDVTMASAISSQVPDADVTHATESIAAPQAMPELPTEVGPPQEMPIAMALNEPVKKVFAGPPIQHLNFGTGEGDKPAPEYPREARIARQEGTVVVQFTVDENGHVIDAQAISPSPYPLLNQAAVRAVRDTWDHFPRGKIRVYDVRFQFELNHH
jgi:protein TonB